MDTKNEKLGKNHIHYLMIIIGLVVISLMIFTVYSVTTRNAQNNFDTRPSTASQENTANDSVLITPKTTSDVFSIKTPKSLLPEGSCETGEILLGVIYNSDNYDYACSGVVEALDYASIVFGVSSKSIVSVFGSAQSADNVTLADGKTIAAKSVVLAQALGHGADDYHTAKYVIYEVASPTGKNYYAVYETGIGFSDDDRLLQDFESTVTGGWMIP
jgi:hypothetical protein